MTAVAAQATLQVNGTAHPWRDGLTVRALLAELRLDQGALAVERNGAVVRRPDWDAIQLQPGDVLELVALVGGG